MKWWNFLPTHSEPRYFFKEITTKQLDISQADTVLKDYKLIKGSNTFQVMLFELRKATLRVSPYLCS